MSILSCKLRVSFSSKCIQKQSLIQYFDQSESRWRESSVRTKKNQPPVVYHISLTPKQAQKTALKTWANSGLTPLLLLLKKKSIMQTWLNYPTHRELRTDCSFFYIIPSSFTHLDETRIFHTFSSSHMLRITLFLLGIKKKRKSAYLNFQG